MFYDVYIEHALKKSRYKIRRFKALYGITFFLLLQISFFITDVRYKNMLCA